MAKKPVLSVVDRNSTDIKPPRKLGQFGSSLWHDVQSEYRIDDRGVLCQACAALDRAEALAACIAEDGETIKTRTGLRNHPAVREELAARAFIVRTLERLGIVSEKIQQNVGRPGGSSGWVG